jgi:hypothetical protein
VAAFAPGRTACARAVYFGVRALRHGICHVLVARSTLFPAAGRRRGALR